MATASVPDLELDEDSPTSVIVDLEDYFDDDFGDGSLTFVLTQNSRPEEVALAVNGSTLEATTLVADWNGNLTLQVAVDDGLHTPMLSNVFLLTVVPVNDPPLWMSPDAAIIDQGQQLQVVLEAFDIDGDDLVFGGEVPTDGSIDGNLFHWTPTDADVGDHLFNLTVADGVGLIDTDSLFVRVENVND